MKGVKKKGIIPLWLLIVDIVYILVLLVIPKIIGNYIPGFSDILKSKGSLTGIPVFVRILGNVYSLFNSFWVKIIVLALNILMFMSNRGYNRNLVSTYEATKAANVDTGANEKTNVVVTPVVTPSGPVKDDNQNMNVF